jgi:hypothetical protein
MSSIVGKLRRFRSTPRVRRPRERHPPTNLLGRCIIQRMNSGLGPEVCPSCGSTTDVRTVQELFDLPNSFQTDAIRRAEDLRREGPREGPPAQDWLISDQSPRSADSDQQIVDVVVASASRFIGNRLRKRLRRNYEEKVAPTLDAKMQQAKHDSEHLNTEQVAIVERYPDLRGCLTDQVVFLAGRTAVVPLADVPIPITLAQADVIVNRLRAN